MFRRRRAGKPEEAEPETSTTDPSAAEVSAEEPPAGTPPDRSQGPYDISEMPDPATDGRVDLGGIWLPGVDGMQLRVETDASKQRIVSVTAVVRGGALQVAPFAAPRRDGIWDAVRADILASLQAQGGSAQEVPGPFGNEVRAEVPVAAPDGTQGLRPARFLGVDGPRWFLRGVLTGAAVDDPEVSAELEGVFQRIVVVRGDEPMAPRDPIALRMPTGSSTAATLPAEGEGAGPPPGPEPESGQGPSLRPFERGPEITETR